MIRFRACRFVAQLGFLPEAGILPAIKAEAPRAKGLSLSRVKAELHKLLRAPYAGQGMNLMVQSGLAGMSCRIKKEGTYESVPILPELLDLVGVPQNPRFHPFDVWGHIWHALDHSDGSLTLGWAILLHDVGKGRKGVRGIRPDGMPSDHGHDKVGKAMAESILHRLGENGALVNRVAFLVGNHMHFGPARLSSLEDEPGRVQINSNDAEKLGIEDDELVRISSRAQSWSLPSAPASGAQTHPGVFLTGSKFISRLYST